MVVILSDYVMSISDIHTVPQVVFGLNCILLQFLYITIDCFFFRSYSLTK